MFKKKKLLITGGTGSFGSTMVKELLNTSIEEIRIFLEMKKQEDMRNNFNDKRLKFYLGDVRDYQSINEALTNVNFVFHALHINKSSCEFYLKKLLKLIF